MRRLDDAREDYADENLPVFLLLGLVSALQRLEPLLPTTEASQRPPGEASPPGATRFLALVLGLIAFRRHLLATLTAVESIAPGGGFPGTWVPPTAAAPTVPLGASVGSGPSGGTSSRPPSLRELLR